MPELNLILITRVVYVYSTLLRGGIRVCEKKNSRGGIRIKITRKIHRQKFYESSRFWAQDEETSGVYIIIIIIVHTHVQ